MKRIKFDHQLAEQIRSGAKNITWRIYDDQQLSVNDRVELIDKVNAADPTTWVIISEAVIDSVTEKRLVDIASTDYDVNHTYNSLEEMVDHYRGFYGPEVSVLTPVKIVQFTLTTPDNKNNNDVKNATNIIEAKLYGDGGSRGNPGPSASGLVILDMNDQIVVEKGMYLGVTTNNQAEYQALKLGMEEALRLGIRKLHVYMDSLLVVNQMLGRFKVKNRDLWPINEAVRDMAKRFEKVTYTHVPRELNKLADAQVNQSLDAQAAKHSV